MPSATPPGADAMEATHAETDFHGELRLMDDETLLASLDIDDFQISAHQGQAHRTFHYLKFNLSGNQWNEIRGLTWIKERTFEHDADIKAAEARGWARAIEAAALLALNHPKLVGWDLAFMIRALATRAAGPT